MNKRFESQQKILHCAFLYYCLVGRTKATVCDDAQWDVLEAHGDDLILKWFLLFLAFGMQLVGISSVSVSQWVKRHQQSHSPSCKKSNYRDTLMYCAKCRLLHFSKHIVKRRINYIFLEQILSKPLSYVLCLVSTEDLQKWVMHAEVRAITLSSGLMYI